MIFAALQAAFNPISFAALQAASSLFLSAALQAAFLSSRRPSGGFFSFFLSPLLILLIMNYRLSILLTTELSPPFSRLLLPYI